MARPSRLMTQRSTESASPGTIFGQALGSAPLSWPANATPSAMSPATATKRTGSPDEARLTGKLSEGVSVNNPLRCISGPVSLASRHEVADPERARALRLPALGAQRADRAVDLSTADPSLRIGWRSAGAA